MAKPAPHQRKAEKFKSGQAVLWTFPQELKLGGRTITSAAKPREARVIGRSELPGYWGDHGWLLAIEGDKYPVLAADDEISEVKAI